MHPVNRFHCFQETAEIFPPLLSATATAGAVPWLQWATKTPRLQDLEASRQDGCDHYASQKNVWLHRNLRNFKKTPLGTSKSYCIFYKFQLLSIAIPEAHKLGQAWDLANKVDNSHQPFTSHCSPTLRSHTSH